MFAHVISPLTYIMSTFLTYCYTFTQHIGYPSYGAAIIMLTLIIKFILSPLTAKQIKSMQGMQVIQPKIKELQKKYKGNQKKLQEEMRKLYKETGVNPLSGCLPIIIQMPFLISIFMRYVIILMILILKAFYGFPVLVRRIRRMYCRFYPPYPLF